MLQEQGKRRKRRDDNGQRDDFFKNVVDVLHVNKQNNL
jgi:hypothetical protein